MADNAASVASLDTDVPNKPLFNLLDKNIEWVEQDGYGVDGEGLGVIPEPLIGKVNFDKYFNGSFWTYAVQSGPYNLLHCKFAPNFTLPRHFHNFDQLVFVLEGEAWQGNRRFGPGEGWSTPARHPYAVSAGPEGCHTVEVRTDPLAELTTNWLEDNPAKWAPRQP
jgi:hypothetical protein